MNEIVWQCMQIQMWAITIQTFVLVVIMSVFLFSINNK
jgi:hypothetical protein